MQTESQPELLSLLRAVAGPGFIIGGWQLVSASFIWGTIIVYAGFAICLAECIWEPQLLRWPYQTQVGCIGLVMLFLDMFTIGVVLVRAPLDVSAFTMRSTENLAPGGILWKPFFTELDVVFANQTDMTYENVDVLVRPDYPVAAIAQTGNLSDVSFQDRYGLFARNTVEDLSTGRIIAMPPIATDAGYKIHCGRIPPRTSLMLVMAIVEMRKAPPPQQRLQLPPNASMEGFSSQVTVADKEEGTFHYWYGQEINTHLYIPNPNPSRVTVRGSYIGGNKPRDINQDVIVRRMPQ
jgi:hypothetical protein